MKRKLLFAITAILLIGAGYFVVISKKQSLAALPKPQISLPTVQTAQVAKGEFEATSHYLGSIEPFTKTDLSARITGNILSISKREGDTVRRGEVVIVIDDREMVDRSVAVNAEFLSTQQKLAGAVSAYQTQKSIHERDTVLHTAGAISREALERSQAALDGARATVEAYRESIKGLSMNSSIARTQAGYARVTAPFSGVVTRRLSEPGDMAVPGKPILTIEKISQYKVLAQVPQEELAGVRPGTKVVLNNGGRSIPAKVNRVYPSLGKNMLATVEVLTDSAPFELPSSSTVGFDIVTRKVEGLIVPAQAIVKTGQGSFVYQVNDGAVHIIPVKLLGMGNGSAAISGAIEAGAQVAVGQENKLLTYMEGSKIRVADPAGTAAPAPAGGNR